MARKKPEQVATGFSFTEGPRWHDGQLFFSDFYNYKVRSVDAAGNVETVVHVEHQPSGLGWLPDGRMLVVSMTNRKLLRMESDGALSEHADLSEIAAFHCNDMAVDELGRAWVGNFGFDNEGGQPGPATLAQVMPDGTVRAAADGLMFPNGTMISPDGKTLVVAETYARRLTAFDIADDGTLSNRRLWAETGDHWPDGCCMDAEGAIWVADPRGGCVVRVLEGGEVTEQIDTGRGAFACVLGGNDRRDLYICTSSGSGAQARTAQDASIERVTVDVPGAGIP
ncbi:MAG: gluconolactonase [OM182 bacterium MED-G24]|uniref:Gluconolactonase n=1 Tax=OM182 bacterium MED-G24 TaxID=1986255 RepID=A0A2A5WGX3_9GAMM|nr:MAG: gluconolactonase [OM182 bacterium MED-G24]